MNFSFAPPISVQLVQPKQRLPSVFSSRPTQPTQLPRRRPHRACLPPEDRKEDESRTQCKPEQDTSRKREHFLSMEAAETEKSFDEMDELAEEWIGANLGRWEWYERVKSRREKLWSQLRKQEDEVEREYDQLKKTLMDIDVVFGTKLTDGDATISPMGWGIIVCTMLLYIALGYAFVEIVVRIAIGSTTPSLPFF